MYICDKPERWTIYIYEYAHMMYFAEHTRMISGAARRSYINIYEHNRSTYVKYAYVNIVQNIHACIIYFSKIFSYEYACMRYFAE